MKLFILAGGKGTRLGFTDIPKPMVPILGVPLLERQIELAKRYGISEIFLLCGFRSDVIYQYFGNGYKFGCKITQITEPFPLGTAGALKLVEHLVSPTERFLVFYGDLALDIDLERLLKFDESHLPSLGTLVVHPNSHPLDSDLVEVDSKFRVVKFSTKPHRKDLIFQNLANAAVYVLSPKIFSYIPENQVSDLAGSVFPNCLLSNETFFAYNTPEYLKDMGTPERLERVTNDFKVQKPKSYNLSSKRRALFLDRDGVLNLNLEPPNKERLEFLPEISKAIQKINKSGYLSILVTNQPAIAKGFLSKEDVEFQHKLLETHLGMDGAYLDAIYYCPHHPESGFPGEVKELKVDCDCRKPKPGMLKKAGDRFSIDYSNSWMIGDSEVDLIAGKSVGCKTIKIGWENSLNATAMFPSLLEAVDYILEMEPIFDY